MSNLTIEAFIDILTIQEQLESISLSQMGICCQSLQLPPSELLTADHINTWIVKTTNGVPGTSSTDMKGF